MTRRRVTFLHAYASGLRGIGQHSGWVVAMADAIGAYHDVHTLYGPEIMLTPDWDGTDFVFTSFAGDAKLARQIAHAGARKRPYGIFLNEHVIHDWIVDAGREAYAEATLVACSTEATIKARETLGDLPMTIIPHAADERIAAMVNPTRPMNRRGFVAFGPWNIRKGPDTIVNAIPKLEVTFLANPIVRTEWYIGVDLPPSHRVIMQDMYYNEKDERVKFDLLGHARALICASRIESFFIPAAEAALMRTPLLSLPLPCIVEAWGEAPIYFQNEEELRAAAMKLARDDGLVKRRGDMMFEMARGRGYYLAAMGERLANAIDSACEAAT